MALPLQLWPSVHCRLRSVELWSRSCWRDEFVLAKLLADLESTVFLVVNDTRESMLSQIEYQGLLQ